MMWVYFRRFWEGNYLGPWSFDGWESPGNATVDKAHDLTHINRAEYEGYICDLVKGLYDLNTGQYAKWVWLETLATQRKAKSKWWPW